MKSLLRSRIWSERYLLLFLVPMVVYLFIFNYMPMYGIVIAFQKYRMGRPFIAFDGSIEWVGLENFIRLFGSIFFARAFKNTLLLNFYVLIFGFWVPIVFALLLNEVHNTYFKKITQTISYLPYFISTVIVAGIVKSLLSTDGGLINNIITMLGSAPIEFLNEPKYFRAIYVIVSIWQTFGWSAVIYIASISTINQNLYEAARIDGANRLKQALHITIPGIMPTISILLIMQIGHMLSNDVEKILLLYNQGIYDTADVLGTYTIRTGIFENNYSFACAVGLFTSVINLIFLTLANKLTYKINENSLW